MNFDSLDCVGKQKLASKLFNNPCAQNCHEVTLAGLRAMASGMVNCKDGTSLQEAAASLHGVAGVGALTAAPNKQILSTSPEKIANTEAAADMDLLGGASPEDAVDAAVAGITGETEAEVKGSAADKAGLLAAATAKEEGLSATEEATSIVEAVQNAEEKVTPLGAVEAAEKEAVEKVEEEGEQKIHEEDVKITEEKEAETKLKNDEESKLKMDDKPIVTTGLGTMGKVAEEKKQEAEEAAEKVQKLSVTRL